MTNSTRSRKMIDIEQLKQQAIDLKLYGLQAHWHEIPETHYPWLKTWLSWEQTERKQRSLDRRLTNAQLGRFKSLNEFDWHWPDKIDQQAIHRLMQLDFLTTANNIILLGSNGCLLYTSPSPRDGLLSRMPSSA